MRSDVVGCSSGDGCEDSWLYRIGWPRKQREGNRRTSEWILNKAKNHIGYGFDGRVNPGEVQVSAVSGDTPDWFIGPRTFEGPFHCKAVPVRRCPDVHFRPDGKMLYTVKTYHQGGFLDTSEVHQVVDTKGRPFGESTRIILPGSCPPRSIQGHKEQTRATPPWLQKATANRSKVSHLAHGGCTVLNSM
ncbi:unnamed protein product [Symbiodinium natans]|uniref:Uncharacterized protein n=1 Tax=Symbiodinium natans TaxID=878477 RepID=A0A812I6K2_9DINO|nr:unnamed protein product [Symbiodinium natans]